MINDRLNNNITNDMINDKFLINETNDIISDRLSNSIKMTWIMIDLTIA